MRLNMLYLAGALAVAVVPLPAAAQTIANQPTVTSDNACPAGWRWVPAGYSRQTEWSLAHCERIPVATGPQAASYTGGIAPVGMQCPSGFHWVEGGYNRQTEYETARCAQN